MNLLKSVVSSFDCCSLCTNVNTSDRHEIKRILRFLQFSSYFSRPISTYHNIVNVYRSLFDTRTQSSNVVLSFLSVFISDSTLAGIQHQLVILNEK